MEGLPFCERKAFQAIGSRDASSTIVGYAWTRRSAAGAELAALYVLPRVQGKGVGKALISDALEWAASVQAKQCELWALADYTPARVFYERQGFVLDAQAEVQLWRGMPEVRYVVEVSPAQR